MNKIKELRINASLTQEQLADKCGVSRTTITMIELDENRPSFELISKLSKALDTPVDELLAYFIKAKED